jgi:hypothetical protein
MNPVDTLVQALIFAFATALWLTSRRMHRHIKPHDDDAIRLPDAISPIGRLAGPSNVLSMRGVLGQLVVLTWAPALTMGNFKLISFRTAGDIIGVSSAVLLAIDLLFLYLRKRSRATRDGD